MTDVDSIIAGISTDGRRADAQTLDDLFRRTTGWAPKIWNGKIIGYGQYHYRYQSGRAGDFLACGFAPLATKFSLHIMPGYTEFPDISARLGNFRRGKSCWYVNKLVDIDLDALGDLIRAGLADLSKSWTVEPT